jgi:hypothetical protein
VRVVGGGVEVADHDEPLRVDPLADPDVLDLERLVHGTVVGVCETRANSWPPSRNMTCPCQSLHGASRGIGMAQREPTGSCSQRADVTTRSTAGDYLQTAPTTRRTVMSAIHTPTATMQPATMTITEVPNCSASAAPPPTALSPAERSPPSGSADASSSPRPSSTPCSAGPPAQPSKPPRSARTPACSKHVGPPPPRDHDIAACRTTTPRT